MLKPENRLKKVRDFNLLIKHGQWTSGSFLTLKWLRLGDIKQYFPKKENPDDFEKQLRLAFSVGLKVDKRAVVRNRVRRQLREVVRLLIKAERVHVGYYLMFVPKPVIKDKDYAQISQEVELLLRRAGALSS
ncbi:MAG: ribonuclease P protein component [Candidatus Magasanikbacteria bacterium]